MIGVLHSLYQLCCQTVYRVQIGLHHMPVELDGQLEVVLLVGSASLLELAVNGGSAATATGLGRGDVIKVSE